MLSAQPGPFEGKNCNWNSRSGPCLWLMMPARSTDYQSSLRTTLPPMTRWTLPVNCGVPCRGKVASVSSTGSWALLGAKVPRDATVVQKLRAAGAILLGKTNLSQWADWRSLNTSNGWSALDGQVYGPYFPEQGPSGSSSGSGVASTLGLALGCLGAATDGSIFA